MKEIEQLYLEWLSFQPMEPEAQKKLQDKFRLEFNYNSNHIEGNTLTYGQTKLLLMFDETSGSASLKDYEEMKAHNVGLEIMKQVASDRERPLTESFIRELNRIILVQNYWKNARTAEGQDTRMEVKVGEYKSRPNSVVTTTGEIFHYATPEETPAFMTDLVKWYNEEAGKRELSPIEMASLLHYRYIRIHPFEDGNGRIARLLVNFVLHRYGYPMIVISSDDKFNYLRILHQCDVEVGFIPSDGASASLVKIEPFVGYILRETERALKIGIRAAKGENIEEEGDFEKKVALLKKKTESKRIEKSFENIKLAVMQLFRLGTLIETKLQSISTLFDQFYVSSRINDAPIFHKRLSSLENNGCLAVGLIEKDFSSFKFNPFAIDSFGLNYSFLHFKNNGKNTFNCSDSLNVYFDLNSFRMAYKGHDYPKIFTYGDDMSEKDIQKITTGFCNQILDDIENKMESDDDPF